MNPAKWFIENNRVTLVLIALIIVNGLFTFKTLPRLEDPEFTIRSAIIVAHFPGADPQRVENLLTDKIEKKMQEIAEIQFIKTQSLAQMSIVEVEVYQTLGLNQVEINRVWRRVRNKIDDLKPTLPKEVTSVMVNDEFGDVFGVVVALTGDGYTYREMKDVADDVRNELLRIKNVGKVDFYGLQQERVFVEFSNARLSQFGVSPGVLAKILETENIIRPSGRTRVGPESVLIEVSGEFKDLEHIKKTVLRIPGRPQGISLEDVATVWRDYVDPPMTMARFNGQRAIVMAINMADGGNIVTMGEAVKKRLTEIQATLPIGLDFDYIAYQPKYVTRSIGDFTGNLTESILFVLLIMPIFAGIRLALVSASLIPPAILLGIGMMPFFNLDLQNMSIASLIIALGMFVDNGVVVTEDILVRLSRGDDRLKAATDAAKELAIPVLSASLMTIFAFLPIALAKSGVGEYCISIFIMVTTTLLASWVMALTMIPLLCYYFLKPAKSAQGFDGKYYTRYRNFLIKNLKAPKRFLIFIVVGLAVSLWAFQFVPKIFFPPNEREMFFIDFWEPYGSDIRTTSDRAKMLEDFLLKDPEVESVGSFIGSGGPRWYLALKLEQDHENLTTMIVNCKTEKGAGVDGLIGRIKEFADNHLPDSRVRPTKLEMGPPVGYPLQIRLSGKDMGKLYEMRNKIAERISSVRGTGNVHDDWGEFTKKMIVNINQDQAKIAGLTSSDIATSLDTQFSGLVSTDYREGDEIIPVTLRAQDAYRENLGNIESLNVYSYATGKSIPLMQIATTELQWQPSNIRRRNRVRTMTIQGEVSGRYTSEALAEIRPKLDELQKSPEWPAGYRIEYGGEVEDSAIAKKSVFIAFPIAFSLLILCLIFQFNSLRRTAIILLTVPPMMIGITPGLLLTRSTFGFMALLGIISLLGIIVNNAIMLIDRIEIERKEGVPLPDSIVNSAQKRLRPIIMTATTTVVGLVPLSLGGGKFWSPMANTIIFGMIFATLLTLVLCPVLYALFFKADFKQYQWKREELDEQRPDDTETRIVAAP